MNAVRKLIERPVWRLLSGPWPDLPLCLALLLLLALGLGVLWSAIDSVAQVQRQAVRIGGGLLAMLVLLRISPQLLRVWSPFVYLAALLFLVLVAVFGEGRGANRWLDIGLFRFQPSELMKLALPMVLAWWLHARCLPLSLRDLPIPLLLIALPMFLVVRQPDLGTALMIGMSASVVLFLAGLSWRWILTAGVLTVAAAPVYWQWFMLEYQRNRVRMMFDPESDPLGQGWNIIQSKIAVGSGGPWGKGWGQGTQSSLDFLPEHHTDFIFAVLAEEFGFVGVAVMLVLYLFIVLRALWLAAGARDTYGRLLGGAIAMSFAIYVVVNAAMISGLLPVVGVPMPLVSFGGTSALSLLAAFGILQAVCGRRKPG